MAHVFLWHGSRGISFWPHPIHQIQLPGGGEKNRRINTTTCPIILSGENGNDVSSEKDPTFRPTKEKCRTYSETQMEANGRLQPKDCGQAERIGADDWNQQAQPTATRSPLSPKARELLWTTQKPHLPSMQLSRGKSYRLVLRACAILIGCRRGPKKQ